MSPADTPDRDEELADLLADLEATLTELRSELRAGGRDASDRRGRPEPPNRPDRDDASGRRRPAADRRRNTPDLPRPPSVSEVFRFTEQYTLPTLISTLEATVRALELLRGTLRVLDGRSAFDGADRRGRSSAARLGDGVAGVGREAVSGVDRALSELETALSESEIPDDRAGDELLGEVRALSAEISDRLGAAQGGRRDGYGPRRERDAPGRGTGGGSDRESGAVTIEVTDREETAHETDAGDERAANRPEVDVEAELESIRHEVRGRDGTTDSDGDPADSGGDPAGSGGDPAGSDGDALGGEPAADGDADDPVA